MFNAIGQIPILMYHQIAAPPPRGSRLRSLSVAPADFARQMRSMQLLGYRGLSIAQLTPYLRGEKTGRVFGITFDDGYCNVGHNALPVLNELGFTATLYCVANQIGGSNRWDLQRGESAAPLMDVAEMRAWLAAGQEIGSHTLDHLPLGMCDDRVASEQIHLSRQVLEQAIGSAVTSFCFPYGSHKSHHRSMVEQAGYTTSTLVERGRVSVGSDLLLMPRVTVSRATSLPRLLLSCLTNYEQRRAKASRPKMVPPQLIPPATHAIPQQDSLPA